MPSRVGEELGEKKGDSGISAGGGDSQEPLNRVETVLGVGSDITFGIIGYDGMNDGGVRVGEHLGEFIVAMA